MNSRAGLIGFMGLLGILGAILFLRPKERGDSSTPRTVATTPPRAVIPFKAEARELPPPKSAMRPEDPMQASTFATRTRPGTVSRDSITMAMTQEDVRRLHQLLASELTETLADLTAETDPARVKVEVQDVADRFYLLDRQVAMRNLQKPGAGSVPPQQANELENLVRIWSENMALALTVDQLFKERNLLVDEHVPQAMRRWMSEGLQPSR